MCLIGIVFLLTRIFPNLQAMKVLPGCFYLLALISAGITSNGQCPSNKRQLEITGSFGLVSGSQVSSGLHESEKTITYNSGASFVTARYFLYNRLALGVSGGMAGEHGQYADPRHPTVISRTYTMSITTVAVEVYYIYLFKKYFEAYTLFGAGPGFTTTTTITNPNLITAASTTTQSTSGMRAQYTPIGIRVGGRVGAFAELGLGYKGIFNGGLSFKLGPSSWWKE